MARYTGPVCRLCRRHGEKLFLKGDRCFTPKCSFDRRPNPPGPRPARRRKVSDRGLQLREKQRARVTYGVLDKTVTISVDGVPQEVSTFAGSVDGAVSSHASSIWF